MRNRRLAVALALPALVATACGGGGSNGPTSAALAPPSQQVLRFPITDDIKTLDPGHVSDAVSIAFVQEVFGGLYRTDNSLKEVPYAATGFPDISSDGLTYTFHLRHDVKFSDGTAVTASDVVWSWNRAARLNDSYGIVFAPVAGYAAVAPASGNPTATTLSGLSAPDQYTVVAKLSSPAGYWINELGLWTASILEQSKIPSDTDKTWWTQPATAIGIGPFTLKQYVPKTSLEFVPTPNWWGGSTGSLTDVKATVLSDQQSQVTEYKSGGFDEVGPADNYPPLAAVQQFMASPTLSKQFVNIPGARTTWVGFNFTTGPFAPAAGNLNDPVAKAGRLAFSEAIDRSQLVSVACGNILCKPATGGVISKGLQGYLGDNTDPTEVFNPTKAKQDLQTWDPTGTKRQGLVYWFNTSSSNTAIASNLQSQWQTNLGVHVDTQSTDFPTFLTARQDKKYIIFRDSWGADYDNPQDWFDNLFICSQAAVGLGNNDGICDPQIDATVKKAEGETGSASIADFQAAGKQLISDVAYADLEYGANQYFIKPYVQGGGGNALYDNSWTTISILAH
ncbi:MAG: peptide ABC transporter substrate-binding protein [Candidatus Dormibacteria bacterium]